MPVSDYLMQVQLFCDRIIRAAENNRILMFQDEAVFAHQTVDKYGLYLKGCPFICGAKGGLQGRLHLAVGLTGRGLVGLDIMHIPPQHNLAAIGTLPISPSISKVWFTFCRTD